MQGGTAGSSQAGEQGKPTTANGAIFDYTSPYQVSYTQ